MILLLVVLAAVAGCLVWWWGSRPPAHVPPPAVRQKIPARPPELPVQQPRSSVSGTRAMHQQPRPQQAQRRGELAIIIDDMGTSMRELDRLTAIGIPMTFSIIPGLANDRAVAKAAVSRGYETMLHLPMEPKGGRRLESNGLYVEMQGEELEKRVRDYLKGLPQVAGANNHMGSLFTEKRQQMQPVLRVLREKGIFFVDSKTSPASVGETVAREMEIPTASRDVFLDNVQERGAILAQLEQAVRLAARRGSAIAICHPHDATIQALAEFLPRFREQGTVFVNASRLVK
ncbi:MAG TPA: divergent polysaccharide deacetylase family protein [Verrucomicrobiae bacterium]|nr:divergent polysaccharide deacetylase family protein [Verrucomicrobiae bacterium]